MLYTLALKFCVTLCYLLTVSHALTHCLLILEAANAAFLKLVWHNCKFTK